MRVFPPATLVASPHTHVEADVTDLDKYSQARVDALVGRTAKPPGMARMVSVSATDIIVTVNTSTGYAAARDWAGAVTVFGDGTPNAAIDVGLTVPASGAWSKSAPKEVFVWSCTAGNAAQSGHLTLLLCDGNTLIALDVSGCAAMRYFSCSSNALTTLDLSGCAALTDLYCDHNSLTALDVSGLTALITLYCHINVLTTLDVSGLTALTTLYCHDNALTSLRAVGCVLSYGYTTYGSSIANNLLDAAALDQFYTDLAEDVGATGVIDVSENPGIDEDDPTIATLKGYTIIGSESE